MQSQFKKVVFLYSPREDRGLWDGIVEYASLHRQWLLYSPLSLQFEADDAEIFNWLKSFKPDGIIVPNSRKSLDKILTLKIPIIIHRNLNERIPGWPTIIGNGKRIGEMAAEHFKALGFKYYSYYIYDGEVPMQERAESFTNSVKESSNEVFPISNPRPHNLLSWNKELNVLAEQLKAIPKPAAIMAGDDILAVNILRACGIAGLLIPQEIAILGINNTNTICETQIPNISSVALSYCSAGFEAAKLLDQMMNKETEPDEQTVVIEPTAVIARQSTDFSAIDDIDIAKAMSYIRHNTSGLLQVSDVAEHISLSKNSLQKRFKKAVGSSVAQEIRRACVDRIADMLVNSNFTITEIALSIGFSDSDHISRYFRKQKGISPLAYRKKYGSHSTSSSD